MIIILHIMSALVSLLMASYLLFKPSKRLFKTTNTLTVTTVASGTYLVWSRHSSILSACMAGLVYLSLISISLFLTHARLNRIKVVSED